MNKDLIKPAIILFSIALVVAVGSKMYHNSNNDEVHNENIKHEYDFEFGWYTLEADIEIYRMYYLIQENSLNIHSINTVRKNRHQLGSYKIFKWINAETCRGDMARIAISKTKDGLDNAILVYIKNRFYLTLTNGTVLASRSQEYNCFDGSLITEKLIPGADFNLHSEDNESLIKSSSEDWGVISKYPLIINEKEFFKDVK